VQVFLKIQKFFFIVILFGLCHACSNSIYSLENAPQGTSFVDENGDIVTSENSDALVELRHDETGKTLFTFHLSDDVDLENLVVERTATTTLIYFPSESDKTGLGDMVTVFVPCTPSTSALRVCAEATSADDMSEACDNTNVLLTRLADESGDYVWNNVDFRSGITDCKVEIATEEASVGVQSTVALPAYVSFQGPEGLEVDPDTAPQCLLLCDDPVLDAGGLSGSYTCNDPSITGPTDDISGTQFSCSAIFETGEVAQTFISRYLTDETPGFVWTFQNSSTVTLDLFNYNYLLPGQQESLAQCQFQCEMYVEGEGSFEFHVNDSDTLSYTVTGYDADNIYFLNPNDLIPVLAGLDGGVEGVDALIVTDGNDGTSYSFELAADDFANVFGFEKIDLDNGAVNEITLNADAVITTSDSHSLIVFGDAQDAVHLTDIGWSEGSDIVEKEGIDCIELTSGQATLYLQEDLEWSED